MHNASHALETSWKTCFRVVGGRGVGKIVGVSGCCKQLRGVKELTKGVNGGGLGIKGVVTGKVRMIAVGDSGVTPVSSDAGGFCWTRSVCAGVGGILLDIVASGGGWSATKFRRLGELACVVW